MKRTLSLLYVFILVLSLVTGCSSAKKDSSASNVAPQALSNQGVNNDAAADVNKTKGSAEAPKTESKAGNTNSETKGDTAASETMDINSILSSGSSGSQVPNSILSQRKIIRNANVSVEVEDFDKAYGQIKSMIAAFGFIQESSIKKDKIYVDSQVKYITKGTIIIRVDKDKFESVLSDVKGLGVTIDEIIRSDDVTDKYLDTESMLRLLRYEQSRLEDYLNKITDPDVIFKTQSRLTDIRHQIENLTGTLNKWNDLVELSTVTINITEKSPAGSEPPKPDSYWTKLAKSFKESISGVISFLGGFLIVIVQAIPILLMLAAFVFIALWVYRKFFKNLKIDNKKDTDIK